jgi:ribosomal protein S6E (S10)
VTAQLALAEQANGLWLDADAHLDAALRGADDPWITRHRAVLEEARRDIAGHVSALFVGGNVDGAEVRVDGAGVATLPMREPVRVVAGAAVLEVRAAGYAPTSRRVELRPRQVTREVVRLLPLR